MMNFSPCPQCRKRGADRRGNNLAEYDDHYFCFACGYYKPKRSLKRLEHVDIVQQNDAMLLTSSLPDMCKKWLASYGILPSEHHFKWWNDRQLLILLKTDSYWQGRNFADTGPKYLSQGFKPFVTFGNNFEHIILVEDVLSALKIGRHFTGCPLLGTSIPESILRGLEPYKNVSLWLDKDAAIKSAKTALKLQSVIGKPVRVIYTENDPKKFSDNDIINILNKNL